MPILTLNQRRSLACWKTFLDTSNNLLGDNAESDLLSDNNAIDSNVNMDIEAKSNPDNNITGKNYEDFCKNDSMINIEVLFHQVWD